MRPALPISDAIRRLWQARARARALFGLLVLAGLPGCQSDSPTGPIPPEDLDFAPSLGVDLSEMNRMENGLYWLDEVVGDGAVAGSGQFVTVHYEGFLHGGQKFDSSLDRGEALTLPRALGQGSVISGWELGIPGMRENGRRLLVIPPHLGYGGFPNGPIPAWSTLIFRVELIDVIVP